MDTLKLQVSKLDKTYTNLRNKKNLVLHKLVHFIRVMEICLISVFIWRNTISDKFSTEYLHELLMFLSSPRTVFLIGNAIVVILFAESRLRQNMFMSTSDDVSKQKTYDVYDEYIQTKDGTEVDQKVKSYKRSKSDTGRKKSEKAEELRRSGTVGKQLTVVEEEEAVFGKKRMSDDEFRDMVEAFIARQQRNLRRESS